MRRCCEDDEIEALELLGPMRGWKRRYATDSRDTVVLRAYRRHPIGAAD